MLFLKDGHWYRSKQALEEIKGLHLTGDPHVTPDGYAVMVLDMRGIVTVPVFREGVEGPGGASGFVTVTEKHPPALVMQASDGHDLMQIVGRDRIDRVEFALDQLADLSELVEGDHLPEARIDREVYPPGFKLA